MMQICYIVMKLNYFCVRLKQKFEINTFLNLIYYFLSYNGSNFSILNRSLISDNFSGNIQN